MSEKKIKKQNFEILISAINNRYKKNEYNHIVINQIIDEKITENNAENIFNYSEKGISRSRNRALEHASGNICLISDDDIQFEKNLDDKILNAFEANPSADIITFQAKTPNGDNFKDYPSEKHWHNSRSLMNVTSFEIAFRKNSILEEKLNFDEQFGLGALFPTGEEFIFLTDALKKGLNILFIPETIVIHPEESSGQNWEDPEMIKAKAAVLYRVFGWKAFFWCVILSFKKYQQSNHTLLTYLSYMLDGIREYKSYRKS